MTATCCPGLVTPRPSLATVQSTPPAQTGVPAGRPSSAAHSGVSPPTTAEESTTRSGIIARGMPSASINSPLQQRRSMSKMPPRLPAEE